MLKIFLKIHDSEKPVKFIMFPYISQTAKINLTAVVCYINWMSQSYDSYEDSESETCKHKINKK